MQQISTDLPNLGDHGLTKWPHVVTNVHVCRANKQQILMKTFGGKVANMSDHNDQDDTKIFGLVFSKRKGISSWITISSQAKLRS
jgi:hypothetical protein